MSHLVQDLTALVGGVFQTSRKGLKDVALVLLPQAIGFLTGFVGSVLLARGLGSAQLGQYALVTSVTTLLLPLSDLGMGMTAIRYAANAHARQESGLVLAVLRWAFRWRIVLVTLCGGVCYVVIPYVASDAWKSAELGTIMRFGLLAGVFASIGAVPSLYFQSIRRFGINSLVQGGQSVASFLGILLVTFLGLWSVSAVVKISVASSALAAAIFLALVPASSLVRRGEWSLRAPRETLEAPRGPVGDRINPNAFAFFSVGNTILSLLAQRVDVWLMGVFVATSEIGAYNVGSRFTLPMAMLVTSIGTALLPRVSAKSTREEVRALTATTVRASALLAGVGTLYAILAPLLAPVLFGEEYRQSVGLGQLLCLRYAIAFLIAPAGIIGYSLGLVRTYWLINAVQLATVTLLNVLLLPRIGAYAAAIALIVHESISLVWVGALLWRKVRSYPATAASMGHD